MAVVAFVLIQTQTGSAFSVAETVRAVDGVTASYVVTGPYDVIAKIRGATLDDAAKLVVSQIQAIDGITRTYTCPVFTLCLRARSSLRATAGQWLRRAYDPRTTMTTLGPGARKGIEKGVLPRRAGDPGGSRRSGGRDRSRGGGRGPPRARARPDALLGLGRRPLPVARDERRTSGTSAR